ncbi:MAG TPA: MoxR family ATPase [Candidatus Competibacteraceae bacterium]|nr:AAA family ATPase [Candidatus Competibacteraceae bacterium]HRY14465.1 MoxR family ATPase [Candidatus Competibacteraceae bacterium]
MIPDLPVETRIDLPAWGTWPAAVHLFDEASADAVLAALAAERPLLVKGEPGAGKSQLARAAAQHLGRLFVSTVVHSRSEAQDLQWEYDAVARLGEAQVLASVPSELSPQERLDPRRFLIPGPLWWVFDWRSAQDQVQDYSLCKANPPSQPKDWQPEQGSVLLIDEIDKAEADLPNSLLETLGNGAFPVPWLKAPVGLRAGVPPPLVVITTNEERELPAAFLRRCLVLNLQLPNDPKELVDCLIKRGGEHFGTDCSESVRILVAEQLVKDRVKARELGRPTPGQAEYLDILRALKNARGPDEAAQEALFKRIARFALDKAGATNK